MGLYLGRTTNNVAEYVALVAALRYILKRGVESFALFSDSELLIRQIRGRYAVRSARLKHLHEEAMSLLSRFDSYCVAHVPREENFEADCWANETLDAARSAMAAF
jgi:ribonuclease HI